MQDRKRFLEIGLLAGWALTFGFFFGQLVWYITPFTWPYNVIVGYTVGIISGALLAWIMVNTIKTVPARIILAIVSLIFVGAVSMSVNRLAYQTSIMRAEIQELRDNYQQSLQH